MPEKPNDPVPESPPNWELRLTPQAERWYMSLSTREAHRVAAVFDQLEQHGPALGRSRVDSVKGSRHHNMKELRIGSLRALFAFDSHRRGIVLVGGDKRGNWKGWYLQNMPLADKLFDQHLRSNGKEPPWLTRPPRDGGRSADSGR